MRRLTERAQKSAAHAFTITEACLPRHDINRKLTGLDHYARRLDAQILDCLGGRLSRFGAATPLLASDVGKMDEMVALNVRALTRLTSAAVPGLVARGTGAIINNASIVAIAPELLNGVYGASKAYVLAFTQSLQHELADKGIRVQAVLPGATATDFWNVVGMPIENLPRTG